MELKIGQKYEIEVIKILKYGVIVKLDDGCTQFIHISNLCDKFISDISDILNVGDRRFATGVSGNKHPVELSLKHSSRNDKSNAQHHKSLDDMIADSNKAYADKTKSILRPTTPSKRRPASNKRRRK